MSKKFTSIKEFAEFLSKVTTLENSHKLAALEAIGKYVKEKAQSKFGIYQDAVGPFDKWDDLAKSTQDERERLGYSRNDPLFRTGQLMNSIDDDVSVNKVVIGSADPIMEWQEFGTDRIPPRPVLGPALLESVPEIKKILSKMILNWLTNEKKIDKV